MFARISASAAWSSGLSYWTQFAEIAGYGGQILRVAYRVEDAGAYAASGTIASSAVWGAAILALAETASAAAGGGAADARLRLGIGFGVGL